MRVASWYKLKASRPRHWPKVPAYRMKDGPRVIRDRSASSYLDPELLLSKGERREVRLLLARLSRLRYVADDDDQCALRQVLLDRLEKIASGALRRYLGLAQFMVVRITRDDGYFVACRLETLTLVKSYTGLLRWSVEGDGLRKDMTIGRSRVGVTFVSARISRRLLNGEWVSPRLSFKTRRENAFSSW